MAEKKRLIGRRRLRKICDVEKDDEHTSYVDLHVLFRFRTRSRIVVELVGISLRRFSRFARHQMETYSFYLIFSIIVWHT